MEQSLPPGAGRGAPEDRAAGRGESVRSGALRALNVRRDLAPAGDEAGRPHMSVNAHIRLDLEPAEAGAAAPAVPTVVVDAAGIAEFTACVLSEGAAAALARIDVLRACGMPLSAVYLELLAPSARYLGDLWSDDRCAFTDVTIGLGTLHHILRILSPQFRSEVESDNGLDNESVNLGVNSVGNSVGNPVGSSVGVSVACAGRRLLLVPASGEQHSLGLLMIADFFARAGWDVDSGESPTGSELFRRVRDEWFDVVGLAVGCERRLELLAADIRTLRTTSRNRDVQVMVGGPILVAHPEYVDVVGADGMAVDAWQALQVAERLVAQTVLRQNDAAPSKGDCGTRC